MVGVGAGRRGAVSDPLCEGAVGLSGTSSCAMTPLGRRSPLVPSRRSPLARGGVDAGVVAWGEAKEGEEKGREEEDQEDGDEEDEEFYDCLGRMLVDGEDEDGEIDELPEAHEEEEQLVVEA